MAYERCPKTWNRCPFCASYQDQKICTASDPKLSKYKNTKGILRISGIPEKIKCRQEGKDERENA